MSFCNDSYTEPGRIPEPHHIPGYSGHIPTIKARNGKSFGQMTREVLEDPYVPQSPISVLAAPMIKVYPTQGQDDFWRNPVGCQDIGCCDPAYCPQAQRNSFCPSASEQKKRSCPETVPLPPNSPFPVGSDQTPRIQNRGPYSSEGKQGTDHNIYRCCEGMSSSYAGHIPGFTFHSTGRTNGIATFGTKQYMQNCFYKNTFSRF